MSRNYDSLTDIDVEVLRSVYNVPIEQAAKQLGVCVTVLKRICRRKGLARWPYRKLKSVNKMIASIEEYANPDDKGNVSSHLQKLILMRESILQSPSEDAPSITHTRNPAPISPYTTFQNTPYYLNPKTTGDGDPGGPNSRIFKFVPSRYENEISSCSDVNTNGMSVHSSHCFGYNQFLLPRQQNYESSNTLHLQSPSIIVQRTHPQPSLPTQSTHLHSSTIAQHLHSHPSTMAQTTSLSPCTNTIVLSSKHLHSPLPVENPRACHPSFPPILRPPTIQKKIFPELCELSSLSSTAKREKEAAPGLLPSFAKMFSHIGTFTK